MQRLAALILAAFNAAVKRAIGQYFVRSLIGFFIEPRLDCGQAAFGALFLSECASIGNGGFVAVAAYFAS